MVDTLPWLNYLISAYHDSSTELSLWNAEMEKEDELLDQSFQSKSLMMESMKASRQQFIIVASLLDRIPNLAGLARTCEVCFRCL